MNEFHEILTLIEQELEFGKAHNIEMLGEFMSTNWDTIIEALEIARDV